MLLFYLFLFATLIGRRKAGCTAILVVLKTDEFHHFQSWAEELKRERIFKRPGKCPGIVESKVEQQRSEIGASVSFDRVHPLGMRRSFAIDPELVVVADRIDDKRVPVPPPN